MQRSWLLAGLAIFALLAAPAQAQRVGGTAARAGGVRSGGAGMAGSHRPHLGGRPGFANGSFAHHSGRRNLRSGLVFPLYLPDGEWEEPSEFYAEPAPTPPPVVVVQSREETPPPATAPQSPKVIEVPEAKHAAATSKPEPAAVFILANGERLETDRYIVTANLLQVETGRRQRSIPLSELNLDETLAANRERGIVLKIPTGKNQIFLGF
jgi:hypothetical protein